MNICLLNETGSLHPPAVDLSIQHGSILSQSEIDGLVTLLASAADEAKLLITKESTHNTELNTSFTFLDYTETELALRDNKCFGNRLLQHDETDQLASILSNISSTSR